MEYKHSKLGIHIIQAALVVIFVILGYLFWSLARPYNPADVTAPIAVRGGVVKKGDPIVLSLSSCTYKQTDASLEIDLVGENTAAGIPLLTFNNVPTTVGCVKDVAFPVPTTQLPMSIPSGKYRVLLHTTYKVNSYRNVTEDYYSEVFEYINE